MNKGQFEIMGLAIIVILVTLGVLWAITGVEEEAPALEKEYTQTALAGSFLNTFLGTDTPCADSDIRELFRDCAQSGRIRCEPSEDPWGRGRSMDACEYVNETLRYVLNKSLDERNARYRLVTTGARTKGISAQHDCDEYDEQVQSKQSIPPPRLRLSVAFSVCG